jgi:hypothetical protein
MIYLPSDMIIKILSYLRKLIPYNEFLKLRFLRKKIATVFCPNFIYYNNFHKNLPNHITAIKVSYCSIVFGNFVEFIHYNKNINTIISKKDCMYYYYGKLCTNQFHNITCYKGVYFNCLNTMINLEKITYYGMRYYYDFHVHQKLKKIKIYLNKYDFLMNMIDLKDLKKITIVGDGFSEIRSLTTGTNLEIIKIVGIKKYRLYPNNFNIKIIII